MADRGIRTPVSQRVPGGAASGRLHDKVGATPFRRATLQRVVRFRRGRRSRAPCSAWQAGPSPAPPDQDRRRRKRWAGDAGPAPSPRVRPGGRESDRQSRQFPRKAAEYPSLEHPGAPPSRTRCGSRTATDEARVRHRLSAADPLGRPIGCPDGSVGGRTVLSRSAIAVRILMAKNGQDRAGTPGGSALRFLPNQRRSGGWRRIGR